MSDFLNILRARGLLADIDVAFARFIGRNANGDPALTLLAALVSNAASMHREIALPVNKIGTRDSLRRYLKTLAGPLAPGPRCLPVSFSRIST